MKDLGERIKEYRTSMKMTQADFACRLGVTGASVSAYENGTRLPSYDILIEYSWSEYRFAAGAAEDGQRYPRCKQADPGAERYPSENSRPVCRLQPSVGRRRIRGKRGAKGELTAVSSPFWSEKGSCTGAAPSVRTGFSPQRRRTGRPAPRRRRQNR